MNQSPETRISLLCRVRDTADNVAWEEFVRIYEPLVYRVARRRGLQDADAREVTQDVLVSVAGAIDRWEPASKQGSFRGWLFRIARNLTINMLIKQQRHADVVGSLDETPVAASSETELFDEEYRRQIFRRAAELVRGDFQTNTWQAFWRTCLDGEPIAHVATELGMSVGSVYAARSRVTARLAQEVQRLEEE